MPTHKHNATDGPEMVLKPGTLRVENQEVPRRIAEALCPQDACIRQVARIATCCDTRRSKK